MLSLAVMQRGSLFLVSYVILAYLAQGMAEHFCLPAQPLNNFFLKVEHWNAAQVASYFALLMVPWTIKPLFGIVTDVLLPASKRVYLTFAFSLGAIGYLVASVNQALVLPGLLLSGCGLSWGTALLCGLVVKVFSGSQMRKVFSTQAVSYYVACIGAGLLGGALCHKLDPQSALKTSFLISALVSLAAALASWFFLRKEETTGERLPAATLLKEALFNRNFLIIALFIWCWNFSPGFGTPLYFHYTNVLHFTQEEIGQINGCSAFGMLAGGFVFPLLARVAARKQILMAVLACMLSTLSFNFITSLHAAMAVEILHGIANMIGLLTIYCLGAQASRPRLETFITSTLIAIYNIATQVSGMLGGVLYANVFHNSLTPLLAVSATLTGMCTLLIRLLPQEVPHEESLPAKPARKVPAVSGVMD